MRSRASPVECALYNARFEGQKRQRIPSIEWKILDLILGNNVADCCVCSFNSLIRRFDLNHLRRAADLESSVYHERLADREHVVLAGECAKTFMCHRNRI